MGLRLFVGSHQNTLVDSHPRSCTKDRRIVYPSLAHTAVLVESNLQKERILSAIGLHLRVEPFALCPESRITINTVY